MTISKKDLLEYWQVKNGGDYNFVKGSLIHKLANVDRNAIIGSGSIIKELSDVNRSVIGNNVYIGAESKIRDDAEIGSDVIIGDGTVVGEEVYIPQYVRIAHNAYIGRSPIIMFGAEPMNEAGHWMLRIGNEFMSYGEAERYCELIKKDVDELPRNEYSYAGVKMLEQFIRIANMMKKVAPVEMNASFVEKALMEVSK